jgi:hypothetical protein
MGQLWFQGGETLYVYSSESDGSIGQDALGEVFISQADLLKHVQEKRERQLGFSAGEIFVYKIDLTFVTAVKLPPPPEDDAA